jgi:hypothetical protein
MTARVVELDASNWTNVLDFYESILARLGAPPEHGRSVDALVDSMVWGGMNKVEPPYTIKIRNTDGVCRDLLAEIALVTNAIAAARSEALKRTGHDVDVRFEVE